MPRPFSPSGGPILPHLLCCDPLAVDDRGGMGRASNRRQPGPVNDPGSLLPGRFRAAGVKVIIIQGGVEKQRKTSLGLEPPHGIEGEEEDVALAHGHVHHSGPVLELFPAGEHPAQDDPDFAPRGKRI